MQPVGRWCRVLAIVMFLALGYVGRADADPILSFGCTPDCTIVNQGDTFDLFVRIADVPDYQQDNPDLEVVGLTSFSFALDFDPTKIGIKSVSDVTYGGFLGPLGASDTFGASCETSAPSFLCGPRVLINGALALPALGVIGSGDLAKIRFTAIGPGNSNLAFVDNACDPFDTACLTFNPLFFNGFEELIDLDVVGGSVRVESTTPVPEPATIGLLSLGLLGVARRVRIQRQRERRTH